MKRALATIVLSGFLLTTVPISITPSAAPVVPVVLIVEAERWIPRARWRRRNRYLGR